MKAPQTRTAPRSKAMDVPPTTDQIAQRAHEIFMARGAAHGRDLDDWLQAERELREPNGRRRSRK